MCVNVECRTSYANCLFDVMFGKLSDSKSCGFCLLFSDYFGLSFILLLVLNYCGMESESRKWNAIISFYELSSSFAYWYLAGSDYFDLRVYFG